MNTREFFFLKDGVSGNFYTGQGNAISDFSTAAVYHRLPNAEKSIKSVIYSWEMTEKNAEHWIKNKDAAPHSDYFEGAMADKEEVSKRKNLPKWGVEIISAKVKVK